MSSHANTWSDGATLNELFDASVLANPERVALEGRESSLTYVELQQWANNIAATLLERGVVRGDRVFILIDDALLSPALVLGLGKAAAVGVRPDSDDLPEFLRLLLEDSGARLIVATKKFLDTACSLARGKLENILFGVHRIGIAHKERTMQGIHPSRGEALAVV